MSDKEYCPCVGDCEKCHGDCICTINNNCNTCKLQFQAKQEAPNES